MPQILSLPPASWLPADAMARTPRPAAAVAVVDAVIDAKGAAPEPERDPDACRAVTADFVPQWTELAADLDAAMRVTRPDLAWVDSLVGLRKRALRLAAGRPDASLHHLNHAAGHATELCSAQQALLRLLIVREVGRKLRWPVAQVKSMTLAALSMNVSMWRLQERLATGEVTMNGAMRSAIAAHAEASARMLESAGVTDAQWISMVRWHHDDSRLAIPTRALTSTLRGARVLRRVDIFTSKLSRRASRSALSPALAAREASRGADGIPDEIGAALLKTVGLYPPGSYVQLNSGELGVVLARGKRANLPLVAALVSANGAPLGEPTLRDPLDARHGVRQAVGAQMLNVRPSHEQLLAMR